MNTDYQFLEDITLTSYIWSESTNILQHSMMSHTCL
jgi:hypothetical protein